MYSKNVRKKYLNVKQNNSKKDNKMLAQTFTLCQHFFSCKKDRSFTIFNRFSLDKSTRMMGSHWLSII